MNRALRIPEILHNILGNIRPSFQLDSTRATSAQLLKEDEGPGGHLSTLRNAALTCRLFLGPSLDHLWWASNDLTPLFSVLSGFQESDVVSEPGHIRGPISESDCILFNQYARKIRLYSVEGLENICPSAYGQMLQVFNRDHLLPCLRYLSATHSNPVLQFLSSPSLRIVCTHLTGDSHLSLQSFLDLLPTAAPNTTSLKLSHSITGDTLDTVPKFLQLKHLFLRSTNGETSISPPKQFVGNLSLLKSLQTLYLCGGLTIFPTISGAFDFPCLEQIYLVSGMSSIDPINNFLRVVSLPRLQALTISIYPTSKRIQKASEKDRWITFFRLLRQATTVQLRRLIFHSHLSKSPSDWDPVLGLPLSSLPDFLALPLASLSFRYFNSVSMADIRDMVNSWKNLWFLDISQAPWHTLPNFSALIQIADGLPRLTDLSINVDCRKLPAIDKTPLLSHGLRVLNLHESLLQEPIKFARCLDRIFPNLKTQKFTPRDVKEQNLWDQASEFLVGLRQQRAAERMRRLKPR